MIDFFPSRAVAVEILGFGIHWYGLLYLAGFILALWLLPKIAKYREIFLRRDAWMSLLSSAVIGVIAGGRLGYVLFYEPEYFWSHPLEIVAIWNGGMSFHGGFIGVMIALMLFARGKKIPQFSLADVITVPVAIGLALGRLGNFINQELYGTVTTLPWGMSFPGAEGLRHPLQLYAMSFNLLMAAACYVHLRRRPGSSGGETTALFLILYGTGRFLMEFIREQQYSLIDLGAFSLTRGQALTIPLVIFGIVLLIYKRMNSPIVS